MVIHDLQRLHPLPDENRENYSLRFSASSHAGMGLFGAFTIAAGGESLKRASFRHGRIPVLVSRAFVTQLKLTRSIH